MKNITKAFSVWFVLLGLLFEGKEALACAGVGMKECAPKMTPIIDKSGQKLTTKEEKAVRKAGNHFLRLQLSGLMHEGGYEGKEHFAFVAKKYLAVSPDVWKKREEALPRSAGWLVCPKASFKLLRANQDGTYRIEYELLSPSQVSGGQRRLSDAKLGDQHKTLQVQYNMKNVDDRWKVSNVLMQPFFGFTLASVWTEQYKYYATAKTFSVTKEEKLIAKRLYDELTASVVKHCK